MPEFLASSMRSTVTLQLFGVVNITGHRVTVTILDISHTYNKNQPFYICYL